MTEWIFDTDNIGEFNFTNKKVVLCIFGHLKETLSASTFPDTVIQNTIAEDTDYLIYDEIGKLNESYQAAKDAGIRCIFVDRIMFDMKMYQNIQDLSCMFAYACMTGQNLNDDGLLSLYVHKYHAFRVFELCLSLTPAAVGNFLALDPKFKSKTGLVSFPSDSRPTICYHWLTNQKAFGKSYATEAAEYIKKYRKKVFSKILEADDAESMRAFLQVRGEIKPAEKREYATLAAYENKSNIAAALNETAEEQLVVKPVEKKAVKDTSLTVLKHDWAYREKEDGTIAITNYKGNDTEVTVPDRIGHKNVSEIEKNTFSASPSLKGTFPSNIEVRERITRITIPDTVKTIGRNAFSSCKSMTSVVLKNGLEEVGYAAFANCESLETIILPETVKGSLSDTFVGCKHLRKIVVFGGVTQIGYGALENCTELEELHVSENLVSFELSGLERLEKVVLFAPAGSFAENYAAEHGIKFQPTT